MIEFGLFGDAPQRQRHVLLMKEKNYALNFLFSIASSVSSSSIL